MIDPATSWFEICQYDSKRSDIVADLLERSWLCRYPWPEQIIYDRGSEFIGPEFQQLIKDEYHIDCKPISIANPQANAILERVHQVVGNMIRTFELEESEEDDPFSGILSAVAWAIRSTYHTTLKATPGQLVFGRDMILNVTHIADWHLIKKNKQTKIDLNNRRENEKRIPHDYAVGEQVLITNDSRTPKLMTPTKGPYRIVKVYTNGTVTIERGPIEERINIRRLQPYRT
jgi:transposase InsO family protein